MKGDYSDVQEFLLDSPWNDAVLTCQGYTLHGFSINSLACENWISDEVIEYFFVTMNAQEGNEATVCLPCRTEATISASMGPEPNVSMSFIPRFINNREGIKAWAYSFKTTFASMIRERIQEQYNKSKTKRNTTCVSNLLPFFLQFL